MTLNSNLHFAFLLYDFASYLFHSAILKLAKIGQFVAVALSLQLPETSTTTAERMMPLGNSQTGSSSSAPATPSFPFPFSSNISSPNSNSTSSLQALSLSGTGIELEVDSPELVFRAFGGDEGNGEPVHLTGSIILQLTEPTKFKHISLTLKSIARLDYLDALSGKRYHQEQTIFTNHSEFLPLCSDSSHTHTLQSGFHQFHFSIKLPTGLPASLRTFNGSGLIYYKLKAVASRISNFLLKNPFKFEVKKFLRVSRSFPCEALEWSQTLDIENTWPGKLSYEISLPRKAFAAGETIPVSIKFTPLVKGVHVTSLVTTIKEHVTLLAKPGGVPHVENRDVAEYRFEFKSGSRSEPASRSSEANTRTGPLTSTDLRLLTRRLQAVSVGNHDGPSERTTFEPRSRALSTGTRSVTEIFDQDDPERLCGEVEKVIGIHLPASTTPTHPIQPITVNHKLRFSAFISNPDGHTSELRCALPLHVMAAELMNEAMLAAGGNGTNALVFGPSGTLIESQTDSISELPSYPEHVRDRLAPIASSSARPALIPAPWSLATTPAGSPLDSPMGSRRSSLSHGYFPPMTRWNDPELARSLDPTADTDHGSRGRSSHTSSRTSSRGSSPTGTPPFANPGHSALKYPLKLPKALTRMAQHLTVTATTSTSNGNSSRPGLTHLNSCSQNNLPTSTSLSASSDQNNHHPENSRPTVEPLAHPPGTDGDELDELGPEDVLSRVPSYSVASLGSLGGGPVPISSLVGLPPYEDIN